MESRPNSRHRLIRRLATGGMAEVHLAKVAGPAGFEKTLVVKRMLPQLAENKDFVDMFLAEARLAAQLTHPNIVQVFDFGRGEGGYYIEMEYIDGLNLRSLARWSSRANEPVPFTVAAKIIAQACEGLAYAHELTDPDTGKLLGLIHRDVSADNVMVSRSGSVKLLDFGIARLAVDEHQTRAGMLKGKVSNMPVEQLRSEEVDLRVDVYALGVVLYQVLTGHKPYEQPTEIALITAILSQPATPIRKWRPEIPAELEAIVEKAMARDKDLRFPSCRHLQEALERFVLQSGERVSSTTIAGLVHRALASGLVGPVVPSHSAELQKNVEAEEEQLEAGSIDSIELLDFDHATAELKQTQPSWPPSALLLALRSQAGGPEPADTTPPPVAPVAPAAPRPSMGLSFPQLAPPPLPDRPDLTPPTPVPLVQATPPSGVRFGTGRLLLHTAKVAAPEAIFGALSDTALADRSLHLLRKFPVVAARLTLTAPDLMPVLQESMAGLIDAALLADEHAVLARLVERMNARPEQGGRFGELLRRELASPLRMLWLVERLRVGLPVDAASLLAWLTGLGPVAAPGLLWAIDTIEPGPAQDLLCRALGPLVAADPSVVVARLEQKEPKNVAALCCVLEVGPASDRGRVFHKLLGRRDPALTMEVMTGRMHAAGPDVLTPLEARLGDRSEKIRLHAVRLLAELDTPGAARALLGHIQQPEFELRTQAERTAVWKAICRLSDPEALNVVAMLLRQKTTLWGKKKSLATKLPIVAALGSCGLEEARAVLEELLEMHTETQEVLDAAERALRPRPPAAPTERVVAIERAQLRRSLCLDLVYLARALSSTDAAGGLLDPAISRFCHELRAVMAQDGKLELGVGTELVSINGAPVPLGLPGVEGGALVAQVLQAKDLRAFSITGPLELAEVRAFLLRQFDPSGADQVAPHVQVTTFSGRSPTASAPSQKDPQMRAAELGRAGFDFVLQQREAVLGGQLPAVARADALLEEWSQLYESGLPRLLGVVPERAGDDLFALHAVNTALVGMAFAGDLRLGRETIREIAELSLFWTLAETGLPAERLAPPGEAASEEVRLRLAAMFLSQVRTRRGPLYAVAAVEAGLDTRGEAASRGAGVVASIVSLAEAWDALAVGAGHGHARAIDLLTTRFRHRFSPELLMLFTRWAQAQTFPFDNPLTAAS